MVSASCGECVAHTFARSTYACSMGFSELETWKSQPVAALTWSTVTPSAISMRIKPLPFSTSNTHCLPIAPRCVRCQSLIEDSGEPVTQSAIHVPDQ